LINLTDDEWKQLASTALTIGSSALDKITKKLSLLSAKYEWAQGFDFRPIATQIDAIAAPARKTINSLNYRSKCVRAVLKVQNAQNETEAIAELKYRVISNLDDLTKWQADSVVAFENDKSVSTSFHANYIKEWVYFCEEWNSAKIDINAVSSRSLESIFEKHLMSMTAESEKSKIQWEPVFKSGEKISRPDAVLASGFTVNFKRKPDQLTLFIDIPNLTSAEFNQISLDLIELIEQKTGIKHVETGRSAKNDPNILQIDLLGDFMIGQSRLAMSEIDAYLTKRFPQGS
jgi:hypothetical protein